MASPTLQVTLECELPHELAVGGGTAMFVCGWCFCPEDEIRSLAFVIGDEPPQPVMAAAMPRLDPFRALHPDLDVFATASLERDPASDADPHLHSYRSGFWGFVTVPGPRPGATLELSLQARLKGGRHVAARDRRLDRRQGCGGPVVGRRG
jgi:hypothetical protein